MRHIGRYRLDSAVGTGAFATVWKGFDPELEITVAVKVLADNWVHNADVRQRFLSEARLLRATESRRVVRVHDVGVDDDRPYFVMDYVSGGTLADCSGTLSSDEAIRLAAEAAEAVQVLHEAGFVHRDIKPSNLLVDRTAVPWRVLVADLGSAKRLADATGFTITTGTPAYMAPEQADSTGAFDGRADVYSLGVVTWELLTGVRPTLEPGGPGGRPGRTRSAQVALAGASTGVSPPVVDLVRRALDPDPDRRPRDAHAFAEALTAASSGHHPVRRGWPAARVWAVALIVFGLAVLVGWLAF